MSSFNEKYGKASPREQNTNNKSRRPKGVTMADEADKKAQQTTETTEQQQRNLLCRKYIAQIPMIRHVQNNIGIQIIKMNMLSSSNSGSPSSVG